MKTTMRGLLVAAAGAAMLTATLAAPANAGGKDVAAAIAGGVIGGMIVGGVLSQNAAPTYSRVPVYQAPPVVYQPQPVYQPRRCWYKNRQVQNPYTGYWEWKQVQVCR